MSLYYRPHTEDWCPRRREWVTITPGPGEPSATAIVRARRIRRVWAELSRCGVVGLTMPSMRDLAARCKLPSCSTAQSCVDALIAMGVVDTLASHERRRTDGVRRRVAGAYRLVRPYGWESYE